MLKTIERKFKDYRLKVTQGMSERFNFGHYKWYIIDNHGHIVGNGYSGGSPPAELTEKDIEEIFERWERDKWWE